MNQNDEWGPSPCVGRPAVIRGIPVGQEETLPSRWHYAPVNPRWTWGALPGHLIFSPPAKEAWAHTSKRSDGSSWSQWEGDSCTLLNSRTDAILGQTLFQLFDVGSKKSAEPEMKQNGGSSWPHMGKGSLNVAVMSNMWKHIITKPIIIKQKKRLYSWKNKTSPNNWHLTALQIWKCMYTCTCM